MENLKLIDELRPYLGDGWLLIVALGIIIIVRSGVIPKWLGDRRDEHAKERAEAVEERRNLIENYEQEAINQRQWRIEDAKRYEAQRIVYEERIVQKDELIAKLIGAVESSERGNARLRHALRNAFQYIAGLRDLSVSRGEPPLRYEGWRTMLGLSADLDEQIKRLFNDLEKDEEKEKGDTHGKREEDRLC